MKEFSWVWNSKSLEKKFTNSAQKMSHNTTKTKILNKFKEEKNDTLCINYSEDNLHFATGGRDHEVRVYDEIKRSEC